MKLFDRELTQFECELALCCLCQSWRITHVEAERLIDLGLVSELQVAAAAVMVSTQGRVAATLVDSQQPGSGPLARTVRDVGHGRKRETTTANSPEHIAAMGGLHRDPDNLTELLQATSAAVPQVIDISPPGGVPHG